jgi:hypothetical protein
MEGGKDDRIYESRRQGTALWLHAVLPFAVVIGLIIIVSISGCGRSGRPASKGEGYRGAASITLESGADAKSTNVDDSGSYGGGGSGAATGIEANPDYNANMNAPERTPSMYGNPAGESESVPMAPPQVGESYPVREGSLEWIESAQAAEMQAMMVYTAQVSALVDDAVAAAKEVTSRVTAKGGYIAGLNQSGKKEDVTVRLTAKIPSKHFLAFLDDLESIGEIVTKDVSSEDVGSEYFDLVARRDALELSYARLKDLLEKSGKLQDLLSIEQEVRRIEEQLNQVKGRMRQLEHWVSYSTVEMVLSVEPKPDVFEKPKFSWMTKTAFSGYWIGFLTFARGLWHFMLFLAAYAPLWVAIIVLAFIIRAFVRRRAARAQAKHESRE